MYRNPPVQHLAHMTWCALNQFTTGAEPVARWQRVSSALTRCCCADQSYRPEATARLTVKELLKSVEGLSPPERALRLDPSRRQAGNLPRQRGADIVEPAVPAWSTGVRPAIGA